MKVTAPVTGFAGVVAGVVFTDGAGHTADPHALAYFARHGYSLDPDEAPSVPVAATEPAPVDDTETASTEPAAASAARPRRRKARTGE